MILSDEEKRMYQGECGAGMQKAMTLLVKYGDAFGAERMVKVKSGHCLCFVDLPEMLEGVEQVNTGGSTTHADEAGTRWSTALSIDEAVAQPAAEALAERLKLLRKVGMYDSQTCAPYLVGNVARAPEIFSWPGSSGIVISNSAFGGRGNRDAVPAATASLITGRTPYMMLLMKENRYGQVLVKPDNLDFEKFTEADYGALGYYIGGIAGVRNAAINGIPDSISFEHLKYLLSPMPVSGGVSLCHVVGVTPEAPTLEEALGHRKPEEEIVVGSKEVREAWEELHTAKRNDVDAVVFGCPHCTISEIGQIARLLENKKKADSVKFLLVSTAEQVRVLAEHMGFVDTIEKAGGLVVSGLCVMSFPFASMKVAVKSVATNSARAASYQSRRGVENFYGSVESCIDSAITGKWGG